MIGDIFEIDSDNSAVYAIVDGKKEIVKVSYDDLENELMEKFKSNRAS